MKKRKVIINWPGNTYIVNGEIITFESITENTPPTPIKLTYQYKEKT